MIGTTVTKIRDGQSLTETSPIANELSDAGREVLSDGAKPFAQPIQRALEERMNADFSGVRIHTGPKAVEAADAIDAKAFTCGNDIVFNDGESDPESPEGQHLLAHELAHVTPVADGYSRAPLYASAGTRVGCGSQRR